MIINKIIIVIVIIIIMMAVVIVVIAKMVIIITGDINQVTHNAIAHNPSSDTQPDPKQRSPR